MHINRLSKEKSRYFTELTISSWPSWWTICCVELKWYTPKRQLPALLSKIRNFPNILITSAVGGGSPKVLPSRERRGVLLLLPAQQTCRLIFDLVCASGCGLRDSQPCLFVCLWSDWSTTALPSSTAAVCVGTCLQHDPGSVCYPHRVRDRRDTEAEESCHFPLLQLLSAISSYFLFWAI